jgi:hypothetical protein
MNGYLVFGLVFFALSAAAFIYLRVYCRRRTDPRLILGEYRDEVDKMVLEIDAAADRALTLVDDKIAALKEILADTDRRLTLSRRETANRTKEEAAYAELGRRFGNTLPFPGVSTPQAEEPAAERPPAGERQSTVPAELWDEPKAADKPRFIRSTVQIEREAPFGEQVMNLHRAGISAELIAARLGATVSEVELVIALGTR